MAAVQTEPGQEVKASNIRSWYLITNLGVHFLQEEGPEIRRDNERGTDVHIQGMSRAFVRASAGGAGEEKKKEEGQG